MAGQANLDIGVNLDVAKLQSNAAIAKAELQNLTKEASNLAKQIITTSDDALKARLTAELQGVTGAMGKTRSEIAALNKEIHELDEQSKGALHGFRTQIREAGEGLEHLTGQLTAVGKLGTAFAEVFAVGFAGEKLFDITEKFAEFGDGLMKLSEETGVSVENLNALRYAALQADLGFDQLGKALTKFAIAVANDTGPAKEALHNLGISQEELAEHGNDSAYMLNRVAKALSEFGAGTEKEAYVAALFGAKLRDIQPVLETLANQGFAGLIAKEQELGGNFGGEFAENAKHAHDGLVDLKEASDNLKIAFGETFGPYLIEHMTAVVGLLHEAVGYTTGMEETAEVESKILETSARLKEVQAKIAKGDTWDFNNSGLGRLSDEAKELEDRLKELRTKLHEVTSAPPKETDKPVLPPLKSTDETSSAYMQEAQGELTSELRAANGGKGAYGEQALAQEHEFWVKRLATLQGDGAAVVAERREIEAKLRSVEVSEQSKGGESQKQALSGWFAAYRSGIEEQLSLARNHWGEEARLVQDYVETARTLFGQNSNEFAAAQKEQVNVARQIADEVGAEQVAALKKQMAAIDKGRDTDLGVSKSDHHALGSPEEAEQDSAAIVIQAQAMKEKILDVYTSLAAGNEKLIHEIADIRESSEQTTLDKIQEMNAQTAEQIRGEWQKVNNDIASGLAASIMDQLEGKKGGAGAALQKWLSSQLQSGLTSVLSGLAGQLEGALGVDKNSPGGLVNAGLQATGLGGVSKFLGLDQDHSANAPLIQSNTQLAAQINALAAKIGVLNGMPGPGGAPGAAPGDPAAMAGAGANGSGVVSDITSPLQELTAGLGTHGGLMSVLGEVTGLNTAATIANTIATEIGDATKFLGFADGGAPPVGVPSIVGERGPELFIPNEFGKIHPNWRLPSFTMPGMALPDHAMGDPYPSAGEENGVRSLDQIAGASQGGRATSAQFHQTNHFSTHAGASPEAMLAELVGRHGRAGVRALARHLGR